ncbi:MAG: hypothetical protein GKR94_08280 [Gammaproteobacteria bacterium]|nr:hypothetical protein [Gammaproteobacteria bacterium]
MLWLKVVVAEKAAAQAAAKVVAEAKAAVAGLPVIRGQVATGRQRQAIHLVVVAVTRRQKVASKNLLVG